MKKFFLYLLLVPAMLVQAQTQISIDQFIQNADPNTTYRLRGVVSNITSTKYGNFDLTDDSGKILVYGLKTADGQSKQFATLGVEEGDTLTLDGKYKLYNNTKHEVDPAQYVSHVKPAETWEPVPISISEFISRNDSKRYILTGVVTDITNAAYGNLYIEDETASILVWGITNFSSYDIAVNDTLTISGIYQLYSGQHEVSGAQYIRSVRPEVTPVDPPVDEGVDVLTVINNGGWNALIGQTVTFTNPFYVIEVNTGNWDSLLISPERLQIADEIAAQLHNGDSTAYKAIEARNNTLKIGLKSSTTYFKSDSIRCGAIVPSLHATVVGERSLRLNEKLVLENNVGPTIPPAMPTASLVVCGTNIENYFSSYGSGSNGAQTEEQFIAQTAKIAGALININADIYAICEIECNMTAPAALVAKMNELAGSDAFAFVDNGLEDASNQASVGFIYRKSKVALTDKPAYFPYSTSYMTWYRRLIIREFMEISSGEKFAVSVNHFKSKVSSWQTTQNYNVSNLVNGLDHIVNNDVFATDRILILGDFNSYTHEKTDQTVISAGYQDVLPHSNPLTDYSYVYKGETGYLDRAFASNDLVEYIVDVQPYHLNTDASKRLGYSYTVDSKYALYRYADHDPILVGLQFDKTVTTTENLTIEPNAQKILRHGQLIIIRGGEAFTVTGQRLN